jgi:transcription elongation factor Elf1
MCFARAAVPPLPLCRPHSLQQAAGKLETQFNCPFCNGSQTVTCDLDWEAEQGTVGCIACHQSFTAPITHLSEAIDVYHDWLDACEEENKR